jgi:hypothetical protein
VELTRVCVWGLVGAIWSVGLEQAVGFEENRVGWAWRSLLGNLRQLACSVSSQSMWIE